MTAKREMPGLWKRIVRCCETPANPRSAVPALVVTAALSGWAAVTLTNPDQGRVVTAEEMRVRIARERERIRNHPHMPPQAREIALRNLERRY